MNNNNIFGNLVELKTGKKDLVMKAVYISNSTASWEWTYFTYYYDLLNHSFYINDLDNFCNYRTCAINIIERIINEVYLQEMNQLNPIVKKIQSSKKPDVFCIYHQVKTWPIIFDKVYLEAIKGRDSEIIAFRNPLWERRLDNILDMLNEKNS